MALYCIITCGRYYYKVRCDSYFITKCNKSLSQNVSPFLLQNATGITKCCDFTAKCDRAKCDVY